MRFEEDEVNSQFHGKGRDGKNTPLDAEANISVRIKAKDLVELLEQLNQAKEGLFPGAQTKIGISGIRKASTNSPAVLQSDVSFRGRKNDRASFVLETILERYARK